MSRTPGFVAPLLLALAPLGCGGGSASLSSETGASVEAPKASETTAATDEEKAAQGSDAAAKKDGSDQTAPDEKEVEPVWTNGAREMLRASEAPANALSVGLVVGQRGADLPWTMLIANRGSRPVSLAADVRLLELEVKKPAPQEEADTTGKKKPKTLKEEKPVVCKFSDSERPKKVGPDLTVELAPETIAVYRFDPRLICDESVLVPGATVTPRFGWEEKKKTVWKAGKKEEVLLPQEAPFVASADGEGAPEPVKQLAGEPFTLDQSYAPPAEEEPKDSKEPPPLELAVRPLGAATDPRTETVTVDIKNPATFARYLFVRRELITYEVVGPNGTSSCISYPDERAPVRQSFEHLGAGKTLSLTSRLPEMCPPGTFDTAGLYRVHARLDATNRGDEYKLDAYVGSVISKKPGILRMRGGEPPRMLVIPVRPPAQPAATAPANTQPASAQPPAEPPED